MECQSCNAKSSVGFCVTCKMLLCETCGLRCSACNRLSCTNHIQRSSSGKRFCMTCYELRQAQKRAEKAARLEGKTRAGAETGVGTSFAELNTTETPGAPQASSGDEEVFVVAKWEPPPAWKLCLYTATIGLIATVIISIVPGLRKILLPGGDYIPTPYILVVIPVLALFWGGLWMYQEKFITERMRTLPGIAIAILNILFCFAAVEFDVTLPNVTGGDQAQDERADMDAQELADWRSEMLKQYQQ